MKSEFEYFSSMKKTFRKCWLQNAGCCLCPDILKHRTKVISFVVNTTNLSKLAAILHRSRTYLFIKCLLFGYYRIYGCQLLWWIGYCLCDQQNSTRTGTVIQVKVGNMYSIYHEIYTQCVYLVFMVTLSIDINITHIVEIVRIVSLALLKLLLLFQRQCSPKLDWHYTKTKHESIYFMGFIVQQW